MTQVNQIVFLGDNSIEAAIKSAEKEATKSIDYIKELVYDCIYDEFPEISDLDYPEVKIKKVRGKELGYFNYQYNSYDPQPQIIVDQNQIACAILDQKLTGSSWGWDVIDQIVRHESLHYGLWFNEKDFHDEDRSFLEKLDKYGLNDNAGKLGNPFIQYRLFDCYTAKTFVGSYASSFRTHTLNPSRSYHFAGDRVAYVLCRLTLNDLNDEIVEPTVKLNTEEAQASAKFFLNHQPNFNNLEKVGELINA